VGSIIVGTVWFFAIETSEKASPRKRLRNARKDYQKFVTGQTTYRIDY
jgi:hypothetical protein